MGTLEQKKQTTCSHIQHDIFFCHFVYKKKDEKSQNYKSIASKKRNLFTRKLRVWKNLLPIIMI